MSQKRPFCSSFRAISDRSRCEAVRLLAVRRPLAHRAGTGLHARADNIVLPGSGTVTGTLLEATTNPPNLNRLQGARIILEDANNAP